MERTWDRGLAVRAGLTALLWIGGGALAPIAAEEEPEYAIDPALYQSMEWRNIGPFRGGRVTTVAGVVQERTTFYMGAAGGGVWKTTDAGNTWRNVTDGQVKTGSVGAIAVAPSDPNVVYVGMGERCVRGVATSSGDGVYRSTDAGKSWTHVGLEETLHVAAIVVHPKDPDLVYVAAQGNPYVPTDERGVYRSYNGGRTWEKVLSGDPKAGASDLAIDPTNPRILYAGFWEHQRLPWKVVSGGPSSGVFRSVDGGDTWKRLEEGLPELMGKVAVDVSPANPERVWAMVEAEEGGLYRSDDGGESWQLVNSDRVLRARAWYYIHVYADPLDENTVYVLNAPFMKSIDGGRTFTNVRVPHGDNHDLWIHPEDNELMVNANDGGANVSFNGGATWSTQSNQPTAQFYRVITDNRDPYWVYGGQQDNTSVAIASRSFGPGIGREDWHPVGGCESAWIAFDENDPTLSYGTCIVGGIDEYDMETRTGRSVMAYEFMGLGMNAEAMPYRFNWNNPVVVSEHDTSVIYHGGNVLLKSTDRGVTWSEISGDLTRDEPEKQGAGGGPITNEGAGGEVYNTIFYVAESPHAAGTIWVGSDDGLVHLTRDDGASWANVTPRGLPESMINSIEVSPHDPATAYIAVTRYKFGDFDPMAYKTHDYGASWRSVVGDLPAGSFVRVIREDPGRPGMLYAGTETGVHVSFDDGDRWQPLQLDLPVVPVTDLTIRDDDLVAATQGRAFWILDDLSPLRQLSADMEESIHMLEAPPARRVAGFGFSLPRQNLGQNPRDGVAISYLLEEELTADSEAELVLEILDADGDVVRTVSNRPSGPTPAPNPFFQIPPDLLPAKQGMNRYVWDMRRDDLVRVEGLFSFGPPRGPLVAPGEYHARLKLGDTVLTDQLRVEPDPRSGAGAEDFEAQQALVLAIAERVSEIHRTVIDLRQVKERVDTALARVSDHQAAAAFEEAGGAVTDAIDALEAELVQVESETFQDIINFPNMLNMDYMDLLVKVDTQAPPINEGMSRRFEDLEVRWQGYAAERDRILEEALPDFNALFAAHEIPAVRAPEEPAPEIEAGEESRGL